MNISMITLYVVELLFDVRMRHDRLNQVYILYFWKLAGMLRTLSLTKSILIFPSVHCRFVVEIFE